jgi:Flp pilus assembly protein TadG
MTTLADERGSITGFVAVIATALVIVAGMAYDGGQVIHAHNAARNDAEQAARAGAQQIDITHLRQTSEPRLDPGEAEAAALDYLAQVGATGTASVDGADITVTVTRTQPLHILPGQDRTITVTETASAVEEAAPRPVEAPWSCGG